MSKSYATMFTSWTSFKKLRDYIRYIFWWPNLGLDKSW